ncbi:MAG TPA: hypothetical protein PLI95_05225 [Polyangiaceae bacterium]|nr:hypothetical protein [Polyangiaceae bacterium]
MLRAVYNPLPPRVIPGHAWALAVAASMTACSSHPYEPVSNGASGYVSDRAWEIVAEVRGATRVPPAHAPEDLQWYASIDRDVADRVSSLSRRGHPLFPERARIGWALEQPASSATRGEVPWRSRIHSFATLDELPSGFDPETASDAEVTFRAPPESALRAAPEYEQLGSDGVLSVGVLFGQMNEPLAASDHGYWSRDAFELDLSQRGYRLAEESDSGRRTWEMDRGSLRVVVEVAGPDELPLGGDLDAARETLRELVSRHELVYVNAHANQASFAVLADPMVWEPPRYRIVVLDVCWSYFLYARRALDASGWKDTHLVVASGRVITGSVESFAALMHGVVDETSAGQAGHGERRSWLSRLAEMNELAAERAQQRVGKVAENAEAPEIYGVSGLWRPEPVYAEEP